MEAENHTIEESMTEQNSKITNTVPDEKTELIGDIIKSSREAKGLSLVMISQNTKINITMLDLLEKNKFSELPNKTYVVGYIKSCSKILGLDVEYCLGVLDKNFENISNYNICSQKLIEENESTQKSKNKRPFLILALVVLTPLSYIYFSNKEKSLTTPDKQITSAPVTEKKQAASAEQITTPQVLSEKTPLKEEKAKVVLVEENTSSEIKEIQKPQVLKKKKKETLVKAEDKKEKETEKEKKKDEIQLRPITTKLYSPDSSMTTQQINKIIPENYRNSIQANKQNIFIAAIDGDSWITYKADDKPIKKFVLRAGRHLLVRGDEVLLFVGNIGSIKIFLNNKPLSIKSRSGVKSLVFPETNKKDYFYPLFIYDKIHGSVQTSKEYAQAKKSE